MFKILAMTSLLVSSAWAEQEITLQEMIKEARDHKEIVLSAPPVGSMMTVSFMGEVYRGTESNKRQSHICDYTEVTHHTFLKETSDSFLVFDENNSADINYYLSNPQIQTAETCKIEQDNPSLDYDPRKTVVVLVKDEILSNITDFMEQIGQYQHKITKVDLLVYKVEVTFEGQKMEEKIDLTGGFWKFFEEMNSHPETEGEHSSFNSEGNYVTDFTTSPVLEKSNRDIDSINFDRVRLCEPVDGEESKCTLDWEL